MMQTTVTEQSLTLQKAVAVFHVRLDAPLFVACVVAVLLCGRLLMGRCRRDSVSRAMFVTTGVCTAIAVAFAVLVAAGITRPGSAPSEIQQARPYGAQPATGDRAPGQRTLPFMGDAESGLDFETAPASTVSLMSTASESHTSTLQPILPDRHLDEPVASEMNIVEGASGEQFLWIPLSDQLLERLLSPEAAQSLQELNNGLPPELRQAYAAIPIAAVDPSAVGVAIRGPLPVPVIGQSLAAPATRSLLSQLTALLADAAVHAVKPDIAPRAPAEIEFEDDPAPAWLNDPGLGRLVVETSWKPAEQPTAELLKPQIVAAIREKAKKTAGRSFRTDGTWVDLLDLQLPDEAIADFVVDTYVRTQPVTTLGTTVPMKNVYALVEIPDSAVSQVVLEGRQALRTERAIAVVMTILCFWLMTLLLAFAARMRQSSRRFRRTVLAGLALVLAVPAAIASITLTAAMVEGQTFGLLPDGVVVECRPDSAAR